ncbi:glycosyltransferase family 2 protein [Enterococcus olivae]
MKKLSVIVPCYNSSEYMERCINSLLLGGEEVEIIIVNDGSKDNTANIANNYQKYFPSIIKVVHQKNGGHGQAINSGLRVATGTYVKVVDSDDWVDAHSYKQILKLLEEQTDIDMLISNYVYEKEGVQSKKVIKYGKFLPENKIFGWQDVHFPLGKYLMMHSVIYSTALLKKMNLNLPQHTFYVDNLYVFQPLQEVKRMYYLDVDLYRYYIGRDDQSVNEEVMISRIDQQLYVNKQLIRHYSDLEKKNLFVIDYMQKHIEIVTTISSILLLKEGSTTSLEKKKELWSYLKQTDPILYKKLRKSVLGRSVNLPGRMGRKTAVGLYQAAQKVYGFN